MIDLLDLLTTWPPFTTADVVAPPVPGGAPTGPVRFDAGIFDEPPPWTTPRGPGRVGGFPPEAFPNEIILYPFDETIGDQGGPAVDPWPEFGTASVASVQPSLPAMLDPMGRLVVVAQYVVKTPTDVAAKARDKVAWGTKTLIAQGPTIDAGGLGVIYETTCTETGPYG